MTFKTIKVAGGAALASLDRYRAQYSATGEYPFLIGHLEELERLNENAEFCQKPTDDIVRASFDVHLDRWLAGRRTESEEFIHEFVGEWPGEIAEKIAISLHTNILDGKIRPEVYLGLAEISEPWQLPAIAKYGGWNECPEAEIHCAILRKWQSQYGAQVVGMSSDVIECSVEKPPANRQAALELAYEQYYYCADVVEQGCNSINNLAAILLNSRYWYFWWD
jgi:hypothetical protein